MKFELGSHVLVPKALQKKRLYGVIVNKGIERRVPVTFLVRHCVYELLVYY
jgi:hypothetical protein